MVEIMKGKGTSKYILQLLSLKQLCVVGSHSFDKITKYNLFTLGNVIPWSLGNF